MTAAAPTQLISSSATGLRSRLMVRLKLMRPRPVINAPIRGSTGINQAESAAEGIRIRKVASSVSSSVQQFSEPGLQEGHSTDWDVAMSPPEHSHRDGNSELCWPEQFLPDQLLAARQDSCERDD